MFSDENYAPSIIITQFLQAVQIRRLESYGVICASYVEKRHILSWNYGGNHGQGLSHLWARSDSKAHTMPAESATQCSKSYNEWARSVGKKQTLPIIHADLAL